MGEYQSILSDSEFVSITKLGVVHPLSVHIRAVQGSDIVDLIVGGVAHHLGVPARHRDVVEKNITIGMTPHLHQIGVERIASAGLRPLDDYEQSLIHSK